MSNDVILENLQALAGVHPAIWIRVPVIPGVNDDEANIEATAAFVRSLPGHPPGRPAALSPDGRGEVRPRRAWTTPCTARRRPSRGRLDALAARFRARGLITTIGGHA